jgi:hypothetical protein
LRWRWSCWKKIKSHFNNEVNLHMCQLFIYIYIYIDVWKSSQRMNLRDVGSETLTILCKQTKMINKRLKCSTSKKMLKYNKNNYKSTKRL